MNQPSTSPIIETTATDATKLPTIAADLARSNCTISRRIPGPDHYHLSVTRLDDHEYTGYVGSPAGNNVTFSLGPIDGARISTPGYRPTIGDALDLAEVLRTAALFLDALQAADATAHPTAP